MSVFGTIVLVVTTTTTTTIEIGLSLANTKEHTILSPVFTLLPQSQLTASMERSECKPSLCQWLSKRLDLSLVRSLSFTQQNFSNFHKHCYSLIGCICIGFLCLLFGYYFTVSFSKRTSCRVGHIIGSTKYIIFFFIYLLFIISL